MINLSPRREISTSNGFRILRWSLLLFALSFLASIGANDAAAATLNVPGTYPTIQSALNVATPGDTIMVAAGTYTENITINTRVILQGAGSGNNPLVDTIIESASASTPVVRMNIGGANATDRLVIQGVRIRGASVNPSHAGSGIAVQAGVLGFLTFDNIAVVENSGHGISINISAILPFVLNDIVIRDSNLSQNGGSGFRTPASLGGLNGLEIANSHFDGNTGGGFTAYSFSLTNWNIRNSTFNDNVGANVPFVGGYGMYIEGHIVQEVTIDCSEFNRNKGTAGGGANISAGLVLLPASPGDVYSNITIRSSQFNDNPSFGILVQPEPGTLMQNVAIECSAFERNGYGILIFDPGVINGFSIHNSNFAGNTIAGLENDNAATIDATSNWWGHLSGPNVNGGGPGTGDAITNGPGSGPVNFVPFLTSPSPCVSTCGPAITIIKKTNGTDNDVAPGPTVEVGSTVNWTYEVTNTGNVPLTNVIVTDDHSVTVTCPFTALAIGASMTCTASDIAVAGQYTNIGSVTGTPPVGPDVTASNPDNYFGSAPAITIIKKTNGTDNDLPTGPYVPVGSTVNWTYEVKNTGNVPLTNVAVTDNQGVTVSCPATTLAVDESMTCTASGLAVAGQYANIGSVTGTPPVGSDVTASNPDHYFGLAPAITIVKKTNGTNNDAPTGPIVPVGSTVTWTYFVTNTGNVTLNPVTVTDNIVGAITCPATLLAAGESMTCTKTGTALAGQYTNIGTATGTPPVGPNVTASNPDNYFGSAPAITILKKTNGTNNDVAPGPTLTVGSTVTWTYFVTNNGNVPLTNVAVTDNKVGAITCPLTVLAVGGSMTCTKIGIAIAGQYTNIGSVTGTPPVGPNVTANNPDNYFGQAACPAPGTISFTGNTSTYGTAGNVRTFSGGGVSVHASAFSRTRSGGTWNTAYLGAYSGGLGVTDGSEGNGGNNTHKIDNIGGRDNYVLLEFSAPVVIDKAFLDSVGADSDVSVWIGTKTNPYNSHQTLNAAYFTGLYTEENSTADATPGSRWADLNATQISGNVVIIAALTSDLQSPEDAFKLSKLTLGCPPPPVCVAGTFYFNGNSATSGGAGNIRTFTVNGVTVKASAFSRADSGGAWATSYLGLYSGGLGVTDTSEGSGGNNTHKVDNVGGRNNYVLFEFSAPVIVDRAYLDIIGADSDMSAWFGTKPDPINNHLTLSDALLSSLGIREDNLGSTAARWANINTGNVNGNVFVLSALVGDAAKNDAFKISKLEIKCQ